MAFLEDIKNNFNTFLDNIALSDLEDRVRLILKEREDLKSWTDKELRLATLAFKDDLKKGKRLDSLMVDAFAVANEVARRVLKKEPFEVQILAGLVIHSGRVVEMKAGEGKTLTETMPVYLNALTGKGVHIITTNDYLAERDAKLMAPLYEFLGLSVGFVTSTMKNEERQKAYASDITYVTNQEVGFDYLRDNLVFSKADRVLRAEHPLNFGIVDEIDSILIDESRTPLIIAQQAKEEREYYKEFNAIANELKEGQDYEVDYRTKYINLTNQGIDKAEKILGGAIFSEKNPMYAFYLDVCLKAKVIFEKDRDYIITETGVEIVDEFTGRVLPGRRFTDGVHQAIEAKEGLKPKEGDKTQAAITFQNFFPLYEKLSGMSGTVMQARDELNKVYKLDVVQIPTNKPLARIDHRDLFFKTKKGKFLGMLKKIKQIHTRKQPILIGARNVETAHEIAGLLEEQGYIFQMLTASDHKLEAEKIAKGGQEGMITLATNMAGRGTDILLADGVEQTGGLFVIGTERHESRRIDGQLIGRAGRQGEPGEAQFLISMEDEIMQLFGSEQIINTLEEYDLPEDEYISGKSLDEAFKKAQDFVESKNLDSRLYLYKYDSVTNFQKNQTYHLRDKLLENPKEFNLFLETVIFEEVQRILGLGTPEIIMQEMKTVFSLQLSEKEIAEAMQTLGAHPTKTSAGVVQLQKIFTEYFINQTKKMQADAELYPASQSLILQIIDDGWSGHLELMDVLKEEANMFSYASEDPLIEYILESRKLFSQMLENNRKQFLSTLFKAMGERGMLTGD
jgi:preprotein translocase subunit SecA